jgi:hypothetical protein
MAGIVAAELGGAGVNCGDEEAASGQGIL